MYSIATAKQTNTGTKGRYLLQLARHVYLPVIRTVLPSSLLRSVQYLLFFIHFKMKKETKDAMIV